MYSVYILILFSAIDGAAVLVGAGYRQLHKTESTTFYFYHFRQLLPPLTIIYKFYD
jgi:hypothetical protein